MEGRRSFVSSRFFASDLRPVPNIVAIYERPRHKIRRDATHVLGGMFGWNSSEETERALRAESSRAEEEATATPDSATPVDSTAVGPSQRCVKKPAKRAKRRGFAPLIDMGASILSLRFQELLRRQHQPEEEDSTPVSAPAKRPIEPTADISTPSTVTASTSKKTGISVSAGDAPMAKKLRLTISTAPPNDVSTTLHSSFPQMPPSPPDSSSNASKAPAEEPALGPVSASAPMDTFPLLADFDATFPLDPLDSESSSSSASESSSDLDSDSPDLSSSSSTRSIVQNKGKANASQKAATIRKQTKSVSPTPRGPSTPPRKKRPAHKPGWIGWVQTEESPDHSRLIRLDDAPVILGRRTRSGREFHDPPPPPPSRRKPTNSEQVKPDPTRLRPKPTRRGRKSEAPTGEKSKQQSAWQEAQKRVASGESEETGGAAAPGVQKGEIGGDEPKEQAIENIANGERASEHADGELPVVSPSEHPSGPAPTSVSVPPASVPVSPQEANTSTPSKKSQINSASSVLPASGTSPIAPLAPVLKLTRSDAVITPTAGRPDDSNEKERDKKDTPTNPKKSGASMKAVSTKSLANAAGGRENSSRASPVSKAPFHDPCPLIRLVPTTKNDQSKNMYIALKKSRPTTSISTSKPPVPSKVGSSQRRSGWGSDTSAGETSPIAVNIPRIASPSPPEKTKRSAPMSSIGNPTQSTSSGTRAPTATSTKPGDTPTPASSTKPSAATTDRQHYFSRFGKSIHLANGTSVSALGKRKEPVAQASSAHFKKRKLSRKLVVSSSEESDGPSPPTFVPNPFERRAKQMELTRKGVSGDAFRHEMDKWLEMKRVEWKSKEKAKANGRDSEKSGSDGKATGNAPRPSKPVELGSGAVIDNATSKSSKDNHKGSKEVITVVRDLPRINGLPGINNLPRIPKKDSSQSDHAGNSPKTQKASSKRVWNGDWGMDVHQVSVTVSGDAKNKFKKFQYRRESDGATTDRRDGDQGERRVKDHSSTQGLANSDITHWGARA